MFKRFTLKKKIFIFAFIFFLSPNLFAYCYYVSCQNSVTAATQITNQNLTKMFKTIEKNLSDVDSKYSDYSSILKENNKLLDRNIELKSQYLSILEEIVFLQNNLKKENSIKKAKK